MISMILRLQKEYFHKRMQVTINERAGCDETMFFEDGYVYIYSRIQEERIRFFYQCGQSMFFLTRLWLWWHNLIVQFSEFAHLQLYLFYMMERREKRAAYRSGYEIVQLIRFTISFCLKEVNIFQSMLLLPVWQCRMQTLIISVWMIQIMQKQFYLGSANSRMTVA